MTAHDERCHEVMRLEDELHRLVMALAALHAEVASDGGRQHGKRRLSVTQRPVA